MEIFVIIFFILIVIALLTVAWTSISFAPFVPAKKRDLKRIARVAKISKGEYFYDLGCGNGRVVTYMVKRHGARGVGVELAWPIWLWARVKAMFTKGELEIKLGDLFKLDLSKADVVYFFGMPDTIKLKLKEKMERELKKGARVVSYVFSVPGWKEEVKDKPNKKDVSIYLYKR
jgi:cyclopropane fatty-acyl-phospholipid synthase-like methyltransferase